MSYRKSERNQQRQHRANEILKLYHVMTGVDSEPDLITVRDLIQDLMHWRAWRRKSRKNCGQMAVVDIFSEADAAEKSFYVEAEGDE